MYHMSEYSEFVSSIFSTSVGKCKPYIVWSVSKSFPALSEEI